MAGCITDEELAAWANGSVSAERVSAIQQHVASCETCRTVAAEVARTSGSRPAPTTLGRYELREAVGRGGMGTVYAAWDPTVGRQVALKVLHEAAVDSHRAERFLLERQVLASLEHPNIARLLDAGETDEGRPWFAMDFVDGEPLDVAANRRQLTTKQRVELMLPVLRAVTSAHQHLVVHRDLKPSNILVDTKGEPHLVDFGIARLLEGASGLTQTGMTPMTPAYASPEQVRREPASVTSDVYSLGVVLYELLTGKSPYETSTLEQLLVAVANGDLKPPNSGSADLDAIVLMALRKDPNDRYQSVQNLTDDLVAFLEGRPTLARRGERAYRAALFVRRNRALVAGVSAAFVALSVGLVATIWQAREAERERDLAKNRFEQVRQLARAVLFDYHDGIADLPGSVALRQRLVKDAQGYLEALAAQSKSDLSLQQELADSYLKLGDILGDPFSSNLGDTNGAKASYAKGRSLAEAVLQQRPTDRAARRTIASSREKLAVIDELSGSLDAALAGYLAAIELDSQLLAEKPDSLELMAAVGRDEISAAQLLQQQDKYDAARPHLERSLQLREAVARSRSDLESRRAVGATLVSIADLEANSGHHDAAIAAATRADAIFEALVKEFPDSLAVRRAQHFAWDILVFVYRLAGRTPEALPWAQKTVAGSRAQAAKDPENAQAQRDLLATLTSLTTVLNSMERFDELKPLEVETLEGFRRLREADPANLQTLRMLSPVLVIFASNAARRREFATAQRLVTEQRELAAQLKQADASGSSILDDVFTGDDALATVHLLQKHFDEAKAANLRQLEGVTMLAKESPDSGRLINRAAIIQNERVLIFVRAAEHSRKRADWEAAQHEMNAAIAASTAIDDDLKQGSLQKADRERDALQPRIDAALAGKPLPPLPEL